MKSFSDIKLAVPKDRKIIFAPEPGDEQKTLIQELKESGFHVEVEKNASPSEAVKKAFKGIRGKDDAILVQGGMPLKEFWGVLEDCGLNRKELCYASVFEDYKRGKLLLVADTYIHNFPSLRDKINILEQVINLLNSLSLSNPLVAALSALESVNPALTSTVEAAALSKMSQRGQFAADVEGPLDIDTALSAEAALRKGVKSNVPGEADVLLSPDIESAYALSQFFTWLGEMPTAGVLLGAPVPLVINPSFIPPEHKQIEIAIKVLEGENSYA